MKIVVNEAPAFKAAIDSIISLVEEGVFEIKADGIHLKAMDPSQISMVSFHMPKTAFLEYSVEEDTKLGMNISQLSGVLARGKRGEKAEFSVEDGRFVIKFIADKKKRTFKIPLLEMGDGVQREPKIEYVNVVRVSGEAIKEALKDAKLVSSHVKLLVNPEEFVVEVKGESGDIREEFQKGTPELMELKTVHGAKATFPLQYLEDMVKAGTSSSVITIHLETDRPLKMEYDIEGAKVVYFLAPRIETE